MKLMTAFMVMGAIALYHPQSEAQQRGSGGTRGGGGSSSGGSSSGSSRGGPSSGSSSSSSSSRGSSGGSSSSSSSSSSSRGSSGGSSSGSSSSSGGYSRGSSGGSSGGSSSGSSSSSGGYSRGSSGSSSGGSSSGSSSSSSSSRGSSGGSSSGSSSSSGGYSRGSSGSSSSGSSSSSSSSSGGYSRGSSSGSSGGSSSSSSSSRGSSTGSDYGRGSANSSSGGSSRGGSSNGSVSNGSVSSGRGSSVDGGRISRGSVAAPGVNTDRVQVSGYSRGGRDNVVYTNSRTGRTVLHEQYARDRSSVTRTFYDRYDQSRSYVYDRVVYHHTTVYVYQPVYVYSGYSHWYSPFCSHPVYVNPWTYSWSWVYDPWYDYYWRRAYFPFRPYARYVYPSQWLVDYYWSSILQEEYEDQYEAGVISSQNQTIQAQQATIDAQAAEIDILKQQVERQINDEMVARSQGSTVSLDTKLLDPARVYVMSTNMTLVTADAQAITCNLTSGDVLSLAQEGVAANRATATMLVRSAKAGNCKAGTKVLVSIEQLQEFENEFNRRLDMGAEKMKEDPTASAILQQNLF